MADTDTTNKPVPDGWTSPDRAAMKARVRKLQQLMAVFLKAGKTLRLYSEDHRFFSRFADEFETRLEEQHAIDDALTFEITPTSILWDGNTVFENRDQRQNLAFKLYRDGVRLLQFRRGATAEEVRDFVTLIAREGERHGGSQDLSVLFWEADFKHIHIAVAETFVEYDDAAADTLRRLELDLSEFEKEFGIVERDGTNEEFERITEDWDGSMAKAGGPAGASNAGFAGDGGLPAYEHEAYSAAGGRRQARFGGEEEFRGTLQDDDTALPALPPEALDDYAMERVYADLHGLERAYASFEEVGGVLAHVLEAEPDAEELALLLKHLDDALSPLLATAAIGPLNSVLRRIALLQTREEEAGSFRAEPLKEFIKGIGQITRLQIVARAVNEDWSPTLRGEFFTFLSLQHPSNIDQLMTFLGQLLPEEPRHIAVEALVLLSERDTAIWLDALRGGNWHLVADAIYALGLIGDTVALEHVAIAYERDEPSVRLQALETLKTVRTMRVRDMMLRALRDEDAKVRIAALRYCAVGGITDAMPTIEETLASRGFNERPFEERRGWFMTCGLLGGKDVLPRFQRVAENARVNGDHGPEVHLALLAIKSVRETSARVWLSEFTHKSQGELKLLAHKVMAGHK